DGPRGISITGLASTKMACLDEPYGLSEYEFFAALSVATGWDLANGSLTLGGRAADGSSVELAFSSPGR
ncbi:MAG TPA: META domain-containing protein, partial [Spirochaetales bacterium]|nr:META domain-containing protein [Spirochaetales bacterium]